MSDNTHIGSSFDDFLATEGIAEEVEERAVKRVIAWQIHNAMQHAGMSKQEMARRMETSRSSLDRLLNPENTSVTLHTLFRAAKVLGRRVELQFVETNPPAVHPQDDA